MSAGILSEPAPDPETEPERAGFAALVMHDPPGLCQVTGIGNGHIRREFAPYFITQPQPGIDIGQARANLPGGVGLGIEIEFRLWLKDQAVGQQEIVRSSRREANRPRSLTYAVACTSNW